MTNKGPNLCATPTEGTVTAHGVTISDKRQLFTGEFPLAYDVEDLTPASIPALAVLSGRLVACVGIVVPNKTQEGVFCVGKGLRVDFFIDKTEMVPGRGFKAYARLASDNSNITFVGIRIPDTEVATLTLP